MEGGTNAMSDITSALTAAFGQMQTDALAGIAAVLPSVLPILAAIVIIGIVIKVVRRIVGR